MDIEGQERIAAPRDIVWRALNDAETIRQCIPGCERLEWISDNELAASIKVRFSLISLGLAGTITLSNIDAGESYTLSAEGQGSIAGFAKARLTCGLRKTGLRPCCITSRVRKPEDGSRSSDPSSCGRQPRSWQQSSLRISTQRSSPRQRRPEPRGSDRGSSSGWKRSVAGRGGNNGLVGRND